MHFSAGFSRRRPLCPLGFPNCSADVFTTRCFIKYLPYAVVPQESTYIAPDSTLPTGPKGYVRQVEHCYSKLFLFKMINKKRKQRSLGF